MRKRVYFDIPLMQCPGMVYIQVGSGLQNACESGYTVCVYLVLKYIIALAVNEFQYQNVGLFTYL